MRYDISTDSDFPHLLRITVTISPPTSTFVLKLPRWRPGRYTYANFAPFIQDLTVHDNSAKWTRTNPYQWEIALDSVPTELVLSYRFFPNSPDAGGSYADAHSFLLNPINCLLYCPELVTHPSELILPDNYQYFTQLRAKGAHSFVARDYQQLADSPIIGQALGSQATHTLLHDEGTKVQFVEVRLPGQPSVQEEIYALKPVIKAQIALFGDCPVDNYDFLFFPTEHRVRHGVEHEESSLLVMGPPNSFTKPEIQKSLLELSSHEFFHTWNVKNIRPKVFLPYDFDELASSPLHYVTEGITTYYGDLMIWKADVWDLEQWLKSMNAEIWQLFSNPARLHTSLRDASLASVMNGYKDNGVPHRRVSFYNKGYLVAMLLDHEIREASDDNKSLDDLMRIMYQDFGKKKIGYTESDFWNIAEALAGKDLESFRADYIYGLCDLNEGLKKIAHRTGLTLVQELYNDALIRDLGLVTAYDKAGNRKVSYTYPSGLADAHKLRRGDTIVSVNGIPTSQYWANPANMNENIASLEVSQGANTTTIKIESVEQKWTIPQFHVAKDSSTKQSAARKAWKTI